MAGKEENISAKILTLKDKKITSYSKGSKFIINFKAFKIISIMFILYYN